MCTVNMYCSFECCAALLLFILMLGSGIHCMFIRNLILSQVQLRKCSTSIQAHNNIKRFGFGNSQLLLLLPLDVLLKMIVNRIIPYIPCTKLARWQDALHIFDIKLWDESHFYIPSYFRSKLFYGTSFSLRGACNNVTHYSFVICLYIRLNLTNTPKLTQPFFHLSPIVGFFYSLF